MELLLKLLIISQIILMVMQSPGVAASEIGVCYGMKGNNLLPATQVISMYKRYGIGKIRLYNPEPNALQALMGSGIEVTLGTLNQDIQSLASGRPSAEDWVKKNVLPYKGRVTFAYISVGNEVVPGDLAKWVAPAMSNIRAVLDANNLNTVKVTTSVSTEVLQDTYPPSKSIFKPAAKDAMVAILRFLSSQKSPVLMVNVYPYFAYAADPSHISLPYATFTQPNPQFSDGNLKYFNLFDAIVDGMYWAMEKAGAKNVALAVSESGWPSAGNGEKTTPNVARSYNQNFMNKILKKDGTPKRPHVAMDGFIFAMFNENQKPGGTEQNFGLFYPDGRPVYNIFS